MAYGGFYGGGGGLDQAALDLERYKVDRQATAQEEGAARQAGEIRGTGTLTHYRPISHVNAAGDVVNWASPGPGVPSGGGGGGENSKAASLRDASQLGEPTSYGGGRGAPTPVEVFNGAGRSYVNPEGGQGYRTQVQAGQAWNQQNAEPGTPEAEFKPVGTTAEAQKIAGDIAKAKVSGNAPAAAAAAPGLAAAAETQVGQANLDKWKRLLPGSLGAGHEYDEGTKKWAPSTDSEFMALHQKYAPMAYTNPEGAAAGFQGEYTDLQNKRLVNTYAPTLLGDKIAAMSPGLKRWALETPEGRAETANYIKDYRSKNKKNFWNTGNTPPADQFTQ
jgi:hypothetical protein